MFLEELLPNVARIGILLRLATLAAFTTREVPTDELIRHLLGLGGMISIVVREPEAGG